MGPRDWFETIKEVVKKIGSTGDTGGSQTAGTVFGKENAILEKLDASLQRGTVRNLQRGICYIAGAKKSVTIELSGFADIDKMLVFYHDIFPDTNTSSNVGDVIMDSLTTNSCTFTNKANNTNKKLIEYQIVELW